jgi:hypothetical protein
LEKLEEDVANQSNESADWRQKADEAQDFDSCPSAFEISSASMPICSFKPSTFAF